MYTNNSLDFKLLTRINMCHNVYISDNITFLDFYTTLLKEIKNQLNKKNDY